MSRMQYLMGIDLGSSTIKTGIFTLDGSQVAVCRQEYPSEQPQPTWVEQDPQIWWLKTVNTITEAIALARILASDIISIGICGQGHGPTAVDKNGRILYNCIHWSDRRAIEQVEWVKLHLGTIWGNPRYTAVKIMWLKKWYPNIYKETYKFLLPTDYIRFKLTGEFITDYTNASETDMYDPDKGDWSTDLLDTYGIEQDKLPKICHPWSVIGKITKNVEQDTGLLQGTPVIAGGGDWACTEYGAGYVRPGRAVVMMGTTFDLAISGNAEPPKMKNTIVSDIETVAGTVVESGGVVYRWFRDQFYIKDHKNISRNLNIYSQMNVEANTSESGILMLPHFLRSPNIQGNIKHSVVFGMNLDSSRGQLGRAIMEGITFEMRRGILGTQLLGNEVNEIRACGGAAENEVWRQIIADVFNLPVGRIDKEETGCFGAAILAGVGIGIYSDLVDPIEKLVKFIDWNQPQKKNEKKYQGLFQQYCQLAETFENFEFQDYKI